MRTMVILALAAMPAAVAAQPFQLGSPLSWVDPGRTDWSHGFTMAISSDGENTIQESLLTNTFRIQATENLDLRFHANILQSNFPGMMSPAKFLPGMELSYRPTESTLLHVHVGNRPFGTVQPYGMPWSSGIRQSLFFRENP